jgi:hypothetical protein
MKTARMVGTVNKDDVDTDQVLGMIIGGTVPAGVKIMNAYSEARA